MLVVVVASGSGASFDAIAGSVDNTSAAAGTTADDVCAAGVATENASQTENVPPKATRNTSGDNLILVRCM